MSNPPGPKLFSELFRKVVFETHIYEGRRRVGAIDATLGGVALDESRVGKPPASLAPDDLHKRVERARSAIYKVLNDHTLPCDSAGTRLVSTARSGAFVAAFGAAVAEFDAAADAFAAAHPRIVAYNRDFWIPKFYEKAIAPCRWEEGEATAAVVDGAPAAAKWRKPRTPTADEEAAALARAERDYTREIARLIPEADELRKRFWVDYRFVEPDASAARYEDAALAGFFEQAARRAVEAQEELEEFMVREPNARLGAALAAFSEQLRGGAKVTPASLADVNSAISLCRACTDILDPAVRAKVDEIAGRITRVCDAAEKSKTSGGSYTAVFKANAGVLGEAIGQVVAACDRAVAAVRPRRIEMAPRSLR